MREIIQAKTMTKEEVTIHNNLSDSGTARISYLLSLILDEMRRKK